MIRQSRKTYPTKLKRLLRVVLEKHSGIPEAENAALDERREMEMKR
jgi:hypothetical protein